MKYEGFRRLRIGREVEIPLGFGGGGENWLKRLSYCPTKKILHLGGDEMEEKPLSSCF